MIDAIRSGGIGSTALSRMCIPRLQRVACRGFLYVFIALHSVVFHDAFTAIVVPKVFHGVLLDACIPAAIPLR